MCRQSKSSVPNSHGDGCIESVLIATPLCWWIYKIFIPAYHICILIVCPSISYVLSLMSSPVSNGGLLPYLVEQARLPIVAINEVVNVSSVWRAKIHVFPTPLSPRSNAFKSKSYFWTDPSTSSVVISLPIWHFQHCTWFAGDIDINSRATKTRENIL